MQYSEAAQKVMADSEAIAKNMGDHCIESQHILLAIASNEKTIGYAALRRLYVNHAMLKSVISKLLNT